MSQFSNDTLSAAVRIAGAGLVGGLFFLAVAAGALAAGGAAQKAKAGGGFSAWIAEEKASARAHLARAEEGEARARATLSKAGNALAKANGLGDGASAGIAQRAQQVAQKALDKALEAQRRARARLTGIARAEQFRPKGGARTGAPSVASVMDLRGEVRRKQGEAWVAVDPSLPLSPGDEIRTGKDGLAEVLFTDGSKVKIGPDSTFRLVTEDEKESLYELTKGRMHTLVKCLEALSNGQCGRRYRYRLSSATFAVRGTEFAVESGESGDAVVVLEGELEVERPGSEEKVRVKAAERCRITKETVGRPEPVEAGSLLRWWEE